MSIKLKKAEKEPSQAKCPDPGKLAVVAGRVDPEGRKSPMTIMFEVSAELERIMPGMNTAANEGQRASNVAKAQPIIEMILLRRIGAACGFEAAEPLLSALAKAGVKKDKPQVCAAMQARLAELEQTFVKTTAASGDAQAAEGGSAGSVSASAPVAENESETEDERKTEQKEG